MLALPTAAQFAPPRSTRSNRSAGPIRVVVGIITMPSLMPASMSSQSSTWLPSMMIIRSPRRTPWLRSQLATWAERRERSAKLRRVAEPSCSTITRAGLPALAGSAAIASNQSSAKLNCSKRGHWNSLRAAP